ncbi:MAG: hypothetical protein RIQ60_29 [Pseudomonadota bacterium]|jgi:FKBP-type peptidyl-prolyl cis-trans isomerase FklB
MNAHSSARSIHAPASRTLCTALTVLALTAAGVGAARAADSTAPAAAEAGASAPLVELKDKISYSTGVTTARQLLKNGVQFDLELLIQGLRDTVAGNNLRLTEKDLKLSQQSLQADISRRMSGERQVRGVKARETGLMFQNEFKAKPGVTVLPGNLMYRVIKEGNGQKPNELGTVVVKYRGTLVDGTEFDATPEGKTATIKLTDVITGWREAIKRMPAGSQWEVVIPPTLAYATRGTGNIGPNETLVFNIELVAVVQ